MDESHPSSGDTAVLHVDPDPVALACLARTVEAARPAVAYHAIPAERLADAGRENEVVLTVRPHAVGLPLAWIATVPSGSDVSFDRWLEEVGSDAGHDYWRRHRHVDLARRCVEKVGVDRVTVVVADDPRACLPLLEQALDLRDGALTATPVPRALRAGELEMVRVFVARAHGQFRPERVARYVADALLPTLRDSEPDDADPAIMLPPVVPTPLQKAVEQDAESLAALGVRVVDIAAAPGPETAAGRPGPLVPPQQVATGVAAMIDVARSEVEAAAARTPAEIAEDVRRKPLGRRPVAYLSAGQIAGLMARRLGRRARRLAPARRTRGAR